MQVHCSLLVYTCRLHEDMRGICLNFNAIYMYAFHCYNYAAKTERMPVLSVYSSDGPPMHSSLFTDPPSMLRLNWSQGFELSFTYGDYDLSHSHACIARYT